MEASSAIGNLISVSSSAMLNSHSSSPKGQHCESLIPIQAVWNWVPTLDNCNKMKCTVEVGGQFSRMLSLSTSISFRFVWSRIETDWFDGQRCSLRRWSYPRRYHQVAEAESLENDARRARIETRTKSVPRQTWSIQHVGSIGYIDQWTTPIVRYDVQSRARCGIQNQA